VDAERVNGVGLLNKEVPMGRVVLVALAVLVGCQGCSHSANNRILWQDTQTYFRPQPDGDEPTASEPQHPSGEKK
jgi:hypothetical protein